MKLISYSLFLSVITLPKVVSKLKGLMLFKLFLIPKFDLCSKLWQPLFFNEIGFFKLFEVKVKFYIF